MTSLRLLFATLAILGVVQSAPRGCPDKHEGHLSGTGTVASVPTSMVDLAAPLTNTTVLAPLPGDDDDENTVPEVTATKGTTAPATTGTVAAPSGDCKCGYVMSAYDDAYFPFYHSAEFSSGPEGHMSGQNSLSAYKLQLSGEGEGIGGTGPGGQRAYQSFDNIRINDGVLELVVPGGQTGPKILSAELYFAEKVTGGVFTMNAKIDDTPGTCQSIFTMHQWDGPGHDEQDIELLGRSLLKDGGNVNKGIQLNSWNPAAAESSDHRIIPYPDGVDPVNDFHKYTIAWVPSGTKYAFDDSILAGPTKYSSVNPSSVILNHWSSGDPGFTAGPPSQDVVMKVQSLEFYYKTPTQGGLLSGCTMQQACRV